MSNRYFCWSILVTGAMALTGCGDSPEQSAEPVPASPGTSLSTASATTQSVASAKTLVKSDLDAAKPGGHCNLDAVNNTGLSDSSASIIVKPGQTLFAGGWTVTSSLQSPPSFTLVLENSENSFGFDGVTSVFRPDVAKITNADTAKQSGFNVAANLGAMPAGTYKVFTLARGSAGAELCDMKRQIVISG